MTADEIQEYDRRLRHMMQTAGVDPRAAYRVNEVAAVLGVSPRSVRAMCERWEPRRPGAPTDGLECYLIYCGVNGTQRKRERRIPHHGLIDFLYRASLYERSVGGADE